MPMSKADQIFDRLPELEAEYQAKLVAALQDCAAGRWGLFGHNEHLLPKAALPDVVGDLMGLGSSIDALRKRAKLGLFGLHEQFLASRGVALPNAPGEPKQARAWLDLLTDA